MKTRVEEAFHFRDAFDSLVEDLNRAPCRDETCKFHDDHRKAASQRNVDSYCPFCAALQYALWAWRRLDDLYRWELRAEAEKTRGGK